MALSVVRAAEERAGGWLEGKVPGPWAASGMAARASATAISTAFTGAMHATDFTARGASAIGREWVTFGARFQELAAGLDPKGHMLQGPGTGLHGPAQSLGRFSKPSDFAVHGPWQQGRQPYWQKQKFGRWGMGPNASKFYGRGFTGHMSRVGRNMGYTAQGMGMGMMGGGFGGLLLGSMLYGGAMGASSDNIFSARDGMAKHVAGGVGEFIGWDIGMGIGAGLGAVAAPLLGPLFFLGPVIGALAGGMAGGMAGSYIAQTPWHIAEIGGANRAPFGGTFQDSERAATMRQRSMNMIHRSHMNARSALSQEAVAFHI